MSTTTFIILFVVAIVVIVAGSIVIYFTRKDRGFIERGNALLRWPKINVPLMVVVDPSVYSWADTFEKACAFWNNATGMTLFLFNGELEDAESFAGRSPGVVPVLAGSSEGNPHTKLTSEADGTMMSAPIYVRPHEAWSKRYKIAVHELGHALGLAHDDIPKSVMFPMLGDPTEVYATESDRKVLREWYG